MAMSSSRTDVSSTGATGLEEHEGKEETTVIEWVGEAKHLKSKRVRLTKIVHGDIGNFTFNIVPLVRGGGRGQNSFGACGGQGCIEIKCTSNGLLCAATLQCVSVGGRMLIAQHDFNADGRLCRLDEAWRFEEAVDDTSRTFTVQFHLTHRSFHL